MSWQKGDWAVLVGHGLCTVAAVDGEVVTVQADEVTERLSGAALQQRLRAPVGPRRATRAVRQIQEAPPDRRPWSERLTDYKRALVSGDVETLSLVCGQLAGIAMPTFQEQNWRVKVENVLLPELAHALSVPPSALKKQVRRVLEAERTSGPGAQASPAPDERDGPRLAGHVWLGAFAVRGAMVVGQAQWVDAAHDRQAEHNLMLPARPGTWHGFRRLSGAGLSPRFIAVHDGALADAEYLDELAQPLGKLKAPDGIVVFMDALVRNKDNVREATASRALPEGVSFPWGVAGGLHAPGAAEVTGLRTGGTLSWVAVEFSEEDDSDLPTDVGARIVYMDDHDPLEAAFSDEDDGEEDDPTAVGGRVWSEEDLPTAPPGSKLPER